MTLPVRVTRSSRRRKTVQAREVAGELQVLIPAWMSPEEETRWVAEMQRRFSTRRSGADDDALARRADAVARRYQLPAARSVRWSSRQGQRWGSCTPSTGAVRISVRLAAAPSWVLDSVIVHELAHLVVTDHDERFDALVARYPRTERARGFLEAWGITGDDDGSRSPITGLDHVQLAMPPGGEEEAEAFYAGVLEIPRVAKPPALAKRGGCWFERGSLRVHLGVEEDFRPARKAHPALAVRGLTEIVARLSAAGVVVRSGDGIDGMTQAYVDDPFGNRIELIERD
ncbi:MAG: YgjP-like metallopeptidase domain-containing protein [Acidimicrobiales bacterium]